MSLIAWILVGLISGWLASLITETNESIVMDIVIGVLGSLIGGTVLTLLTTGSLDLTNGFTGFNLGSVVVSVLGAVILLVIVKYFKNNNSSHHA